MVMYRERLTGPLCGKWQELVRWKSQGRRQGPAVWPGGGHRKADIECPASYLTDPDDHE